MSSPFAPPESDPDDVADEASNRNTPLIISATSALLGPAFFCLCAGGPNGLAGVITVSVAAYAGVAWGDSTAEYSTLETGLFFAMTGLGLLSGLAHMAFTVVF